MASLSADVFLAQLRADNSLATTLRIFLKNKLESLKLKSASERCPALVDVARSAGVSVASPQGGWLTKSALVEALVNALSSAASVSSAFFAERCRCVSGGAPGHGPAAARRWSDLGAREVTAVPGQGKHILFLV